MLFVKSTPAHSLNIKQQIPLNIFIFLHIIQLQIELCELWLTADTFFSIMKSVYNCKLMKANTITRTA